MRTLLLWLLLAGIVAYWLFGEQLRAPAPPITGRDVQVRDGDSLVLGGVGVRLHGIDAPEYRQPCLDARGAAWPCGKTARAELAALTKGQALDCLARAVDRYGRRVAVCTTGGRDLGAAQVERGWAISLDDAYVIEEARARAAKAGIWRGRFARPADWRTANAAKTPAAPD